MNHRRKRVAATACALVVGVVALIGVTPTARAADNEVLILASTVTGGASSIEASEVAAKGLTPVLADDAMWQAMTAAQFASYRAIILGDPTCGGQVPVAALSNVATWGSAIDGNVVISGTDPVFHAGQGGETVTRRAVDFAVDQAGKTGAYISLSCYYHDTAAQTPVPLLDALRPGGFTLTGVGCYNDAHIVATHPALSGLTDADISNWSCSVHEAFDQWPPDFTVLAIAKDFGSSYTASDGTIGTPYVLARGTGLRSFPLSLDPTSQQAALESPATVTAQLLDGTTGAPVAGTTLSLRVAAGPNTGAAGTCSPTTCVTDTAGHVAYTYRGTQAGTDTVQVWIDTNGDRTPSAGEPQTTAAITWTTPTSTADYVALGDSYSSGEGTFEYYPDTDDPLAFNMCHRSPRAYGPLLANDEALGTMTFAACSGAQTHDFYANHHDSINEPRQLNRLDTNTKTVTLTIGGNDAGFEHVLRACIGHWECSQDKTLRRYVDDRLKALAGQPHGRIDGLPVHRLLDIYRDIHKEAPNAKIYVGGYPRLFGKGQKNYDRNDRAPSKSVCYIAGLRVDAGSVDYLDALWIDVLANRLNGVISSEVDAAKQEGIPIAFVPAALFAGHGLCDVSTPWINDLVFTDNPLDPEPESFHPNTAGQRFGYEAMFRIVMRRG